MLSKSKDVSVVSAMQNLKHESAYAVLYSCATDWWLLFPRKTESTLLLSRKSQIDDTLYNNLKKDVANLIDGYDVEERWATKTV